MKLLLTSNGLSNDSIRKALKKMVKGRIKIAFIPTAANTSESEKSWLVNDLANCAKVGEIDVVDISALPKSVWLSRLEKANVIFVGGGDTVHLLEWVRRSGFDKELPGLLRKRIYAGISAGSIVTNKTIQSTSSYIFNGEKAPKGLGYVDFYIRPHLGSDKPKFKKINDRVLRSLASRLDGDLYAIDDDSAVLVDGKKIEVVSEGKWKLYKGSK